MFLKKRKMQVNASIKRAVNQHFTQKKYLYLHLGISNNKGLFFTYILNFIKNHMQVCKYSIKAVNQYFTQKKYLHLLAFRAKNNLFSGVKLLNIKVLRLCKYL